MPSMIIMPMTEHDDVNDRKVDSQHLGVFHQGKPLPRVE